MFAVAKTVHIATVVITIGFFMVRAAWMLDVSPLLGRRWVRVVPHVIDTLLFFSGVALVALTQRYPLPGWLIAKLTGLVVYIVLGSLALRRAPTEALRVVSLAGALLAVSYVVMVALTRSALLGIL